MLLRARTRPGRRPRRPRALNPRLEPLEIRLTPAATHLAILSSPPPVFAAGQAFGLIVAAEDDSGNIVTTQSGEVIVGLPSNFVGSFLGGTTNATLTAGVATFSGLTMDQAGHGYTLIASCGGLTSATTASFDVTPATASQLVVTSPPPATVTAGQAFGLTVAVEDQFGNVATGYSGNLAVAPSNAAVEGTLGGVLTVAVANGQATFALSLVNAGAAFTLQVSATGLPSVTTSPFSVTAGPATQLGVVTPPPTAVTAGAGFGLVLAAEDQYGNVVSSATGSVTLGLASDPGDDTLNGNTTEPFSGGLATFTGLTLIKASSGYALQATYTGPISPAPPALSSNALAFSVKPGTAAQLVLTSAPPSSLTAGVPFGMVLAAEDPYGNLDPTVTGSVTVALAINPGGATLSGTTNVQLSNGLAAFAGLSLNKSGSGYTLQASSSGLSPATVGFGVSSAAVTQLVASVPTTVTAGQPVTVKVTAEDAFGNIVTTFGGNLSVLGLAGSGTWTTGSAVNGAATFLGPTYDTAGVDTLSIQGKNDDGSLTFTATRTVAVTAAPATQLLLTSPPPSRIAAGSPFGLVLAAADSYGNVDPAFVGNVTLALGNNPSGDALAGTANATFSNGLATLTGLTLNKVGSGYTLQASSQGLSPVTATFDVTPGVVTQLVVISPVPKTVAVGAAFGLTIAAEDSSGNIDTTHTGSVTVALGNNPSGGILAGTTNVQFSNGLASFTNLTLNEAGSGYTLVVASSGLAPPASSDSLTFDVTSGATTSSGTSSGNTTSSGTSSGNTTSGNTTSAADLHLVVSDSPGTVVAGKYFQLDVTVEDNTGATVTGFTGKVTLAMANNPRGAVLGGNLTMPISQGTLTFYGLTLDAAGSGYTIQATSSGLSAVSSPITVVNPPAELMVTNQPPAGVSLNQPFGLTVTVADAFGALAPGYSGRVTIALVGAHGGAVLRGPRTATVINGVATFTGLRLARAHTGASLAIRVTADGLSGATTGSFIVTPAAAKHRHVVALKRSRPRP